MRLIEGVVWWFDQTALMSMPLVFTISLLAVVVSLLVWGRKQVRRIAICIGVPMFCVIIYLILLGVAHGWSAEIAEQRVAAFIEAASQGRPIDGYVVSDRSDWTPSDFKGECKVSVFDNFFGRWDLHATAHDGKSCYVTLAGWDGKWQIHLEQFN